MRCSTATDSDPLQSHWLPSIAIPPHRVVALVCHPLSDTPFLGERAAKIPQPPGAYKCLDVPKQVLSLQPNPSAQMNVYDFGMQGHAKYLSGRSNENLRDLSTRHPPGPMVRGSHGRFVNCSTRKRMELVHLGLLIPQVLCSQTFPLFLFTNRIMIKIIQICISDALKVVPWHGSPEGYTRNGTSGCYGRITVWILPAGASKFRTIIYLDCSTWQELPSLRKPFRRGSASRDTQDGGT